MQTITSSPCIKKALGASALETWLTASGALFLLAAIGAFAAVLLSTARLRPRTSATRHAWVGLAVAVLLLIPAANLIAGDPLGFDDQVLPNCATLAPLGEVS
jgi:hypothetical protein